MRMHLLFLAFIMNLKGIKFPPKLFITGIDTDAGKSYVTGYLAKSMLEQGIDVTTLKFIQTGNVGFSEDIEVHRRLMDIDMTDEDNKFITAPEIFSYPCSPDLAARIDGREIDFDKIDKSIGFLAANHDIVLIEGAGGIMVPLKDEYLTIDYIKEHDLPVILTVNSTLGSINHALLSLYAIKQYELHLFAVIYNPYYDTDKIIAEDTRNYIGKWLEHHFKNTLYIIME